MAQTAAIAESPDVFEPGLADPSPRPPAPAPQKTRLGRPPEEEKEIPTKEFFSTLAGLNDTQWQQHIVYIWRLDPFFDNTNGGRDPKYIAIETRAITEENLKEEHGSGSYKLWLNNGNKRVAVATVSISDPDYPPHMPPGDWTNHPRNKKWQSWKPLIDKWWTQKVKDSTGMTAQPVTTGVPEYMVQFMNEVRSELARRPDMSGGAKDQLMGSIVTILPALLQQQNTANDPAKMIEALSKAKEMIAPAAPVQDNTMMAFVLSQLTRLQESNDKLMGLLLSQKATENKMPDPLAQVETMTKIITAVSGIVQPAAPKEWYQDLAETLGPKVVDLTSQIVTMNAMNNRRPNPSQQQPVQQRPPQLVQQPQPIPPQANYPVPPQAAPEVPAQPPQDQSQGGPEMDTMQRSMLINVAQLAGQALNLSLAGDQFAEQICYKFGQIVYDQFCSSISKEQLIPAFKAIPEAWQFVAPFEADLPNFIDSFYAFPESEEEDDPKSISPEPPEDLKPVKVKKSKK
jgi:hypothetical protein